MHVYIKYMYIAVYLRYHVSLLVNINIFYMTPQRATWKNSYYMLNVLPSLNKVLLLLLLKHNIKLRHDTFLAYICLQEQEKSSDIEQQPAFGYCKYSKTLLQKKGEGTYGNII